MSDSLKYRPDIDGLRALAVLGVLIYHGEFYLGKDMQLLSGGFLGVDVFFVISGYLITSIILRELANNSFTFADFYERRARRILPALLLVLICTVPLAWYLLLPQAMIDYSGSLISSIFFYSNFLFWSEDPYWATASEYKPLLHTWSLAVEEQYYLIVPGLLILLHRNFRHHTGATFALLFVASLAAAIIMTPENRESTFYLLPFRFWELMAGGIVAWMDIELGRKGSSRSSYLLSLAGLAGLLYSFIFLSEDFLHPHWATLIPVISTAIIIRFCTRGDFTYRILSFRAIVFIGVISYSLYLWHYPILSFARHYDDDLNNQTVAALLGLSVLLAYASYRFVEQPVRKMRSRRQFLTVAVPVTMVAPVLVLIGFSLTATSHGLPQRFPTEFLALDLEKLKNIRHETLADMRESAITSSINDKGGLVYITGDSHSGNVYLALSQQGHGNIRYFNNQFSVSPVKKDQQCFNVEDPEYTGILNDPAFQKADVVIISERFARYRKEKKYLDIQLQCLSDYIAFLKRQNKQVLLFSLSNIFSRQQWDQTDWAFTNLTVRNSRLFAGEAYLLSGSTDPVEFEQQAYESMNSQVKGTNRILKKFAHEKNIAFFDSSVISCQSGNSRCDIVTPEGELIYFDSTHFTVPGARYLGGKFLEAGLSEMMQSLLNAAGRPQEQL